MKPSDQTKNGPLKNKYVHVSKPDVCSDVDGERFGEMGAKEMFQSTLIKFPNAKQLQQLIQRCKFKRREEGDSGTTWLELYVLYKMCGGTDRDLKPKRAAMRKPSKEKYLRNFKMGLKQVIKDTMRH